MGLTQATGHVVARFVGSVAASPPSARGDVVPHGTQQAVFDQMFWVFTGLGTAVGTVVIGYLFWNSYRYRVSAVDGDEDEDDVFRPELGVLPSGDHGGRHLLISFSLSALVVVSLIAWTYGALLFLTAGSQAAPSPAGAQGQMTVTVTGHQFYWEFTYHNVSGHDESLTTRNELRIPENTEVRLRVRSADVFHTFGIPALKVKTDAIPGQTTTTWVVAHDRGEYVARCYELCGTGHSYMTATVAVTGRESFDRWYTNRTATATTATNTANANTTES